MVFVFIFLPKREFFFSYILLTISLNLRFYLHDQSSSYIWNCDIRKKFQENCWKLLSLLFARLKHLFVFKLSEFNNDWIQGTYDLKFINKILNI